MVLNVLPVGDVGGVAGELGRDLTQRAQRLGGQRTAVGAHPHHEVRGLQQFGVVVTGEGAVIALLTLGVKAHPAHPAPQVGLVDAVEALLGVDIEDAGADVEGVILLFEHLVGVQWIAATQRPLTLIASLRGSWLGLNLGHGLAPLMEPTAGMRLSPVGLSGGADPAAS